MIEKLVEYLEYEVQETERILTSKEGYEWAKADPVRILNNTQAHGVGAVMFIQYLGVKYEDTEKPWNDFLESLYKIKEKTVDNKEE